LLSHYITVYVQVKREDVEAGLATIEHLETRLFQRVQADSLCWEQRDTTSKDRPPFLRGSFNLQEACPKADGGPASTRNPIQVRVWWQNKQGHTFDEVHQYTLVCTLDRDEKDRLGYAFTFIPEGIISRKDTFLSQQEQKVVQY
jgi:hypothetical protein